MLFTCWEALARYDAAQDRQIGESGLTREEALRICAQTGHHLNFDEKERGFIAPRAIADLVVVGANPMTCRLDELPKLPVDYTLLDGKIVYSREEG